MHELLLTNNEQYICYSIYSSLFKLIEKVQLFIVHVNINR